MTAMLRARRAAQGVNGDEKPVVRVCPGREDSVGRPSNVVDRRRATGAKHCLSLWKSSQ